MKRPFALDDLRILMTAPGGSPQRRMLTARRSAAGRQSPARRYLAPTILVLAIVTVLLPAARQAMLRTAGGWLVAEDRLAPADVIVVAVDGGPAGVLEAAALVQQGIAGRVALLAERSTAAEREFARRGVAYEDAAIGSASLNSGSPRSSGFRPREGTESGRRVLAVVHSAQVKHRDRQQRDHSRSSGA